MCALFLLAHQAWWVYRKDNERIVDGSNDLLHYFINIEACRLNVMTADQIKIQPGTPARCNVLGLKLPSLAVYYRLVISRRVAELSGVLEGHDRRLLRCLLHNVEKHENNLLILIMAVAPDLRHTAPLPDIRA